MSQSGNVWDKRRDGELLLLAENRAHGPKGLPNAGPSSADVFDYIKRFYNPQRRHSTIGYVISPMEFERKVVSA